MVEKAHVLAVDSKTKASAAVSILSGLGQLALQLSDYHSPTIAVVLLLTMVAPAAYAAWHGTNVWRESKRKPPLEFKPIYLIGIILMIAAGAAGWLLRGSTNTTVTLASVPMIAPTPAPPIKQFYSETDKNKIADSLEALDTTLNDFLSRLDAAGAGLGAVNPVPLRQMLVAANKTAFFVERKPPPTSAAVTEMVSGAADRAIKSAESLRDLMKELDTLIERTKVPVRVFDSKMEEILQRRDSMKYTSTVTGKADTCAYHIKTAQKYIMKYTADVDLFLELLGTTCFQELGAALGDLKQWIDQTKRRAAAARQEL